MASDYKDYTGEDISVRFSPTRCIHSEECVHNLPAVFNTANRPWITPDGASADEVAGVVMRCPTGALQFERHDGGEAEQPAGTTTIHLGQDGPLYVRGHLKLKGHKGELDETETRAALCRCGASANKPYCDGKHNDAGFSDPAVFASEPDANAEPGEGGVLTVQAARNGPLILQGHIELVDAQGRAFRGKRAALCRCGQSANKPFCDGSHKTVGFQAE